MKAIWTFLVSRNTAIVLLIAVLLVLTIGAALPNPGLMAPADAEELRADSPVLFWLGDHFNSMKVGRSRAFAVVGFLLLLSTASCSIDRVIKRLKAGSGNVLTASSPENRMELEVADPGRAESELVRLLRKRSWRVAVRQDGADRLITAVKGEAGFWGSVFFHAVLITLFAGLVVYQFTAFYATMVFTEGQGMELAAQNFSKIERTPAGGFSLPPLAFTLKSFTTGYHDDGTAVDYTADFRVADIATGREWTRVMKVNQPFSHGGVDFVITQAGHSPRFVLSRNGRNVYDSYVALKSDPENPDSLDIPGEEMVVAARFFPDLARNPDGSVFTRGRMPRNPHFGLEVTQRGRRLFRGLVGKGESVSFDGYRLEFRDLRSWVAMDLVRESGIGFFFWCAMAGLIGLFVRFIDPDRTITSAVGRKDGRHTMTFITTAKHFSGILGEQLDATIAAVAEDQRRR